MLYEIQEGDITIPVKLSYHHAGLKVNEESFWLGQGWSLQAEPSIAVGVNGKRDPFYYTSAEDNTINRSAPEYLRNLHNKDFTTLDESPDQYFYRLLDRSGSFYFRFDKNRSNTTNKIYEASTIPYDPLKISRIEENLFEITDDNGIKYRFGKSMDDNRIYNESVTLERKTTLWKCTEITSSNKKDIIKFKYNDEEKGINYSLNDYVKVQDIPSRYGTPPSFPSSYPFYVFTNTSGTNQANYECMSWTNYGGTLRCAGQGFVPRSIGGTTVNEIITTYNRKIKSIQFKNGTVEFEQKIKGYNNYLDNIKVKDKNGNVIKHIKFNNRFLQWLIYYYPVLTSIEIQGQPGSPVERYTFDYNGDPTVGYDMYTNMNFWGYRINGLGFSYNGVQSTSLPMACYGPNGEDYTERLMFVGGNYRFGAINKNGILKSIINPLGGKTEFIYEQAYYQRRKREDNVNPSINIYYFEKVDAGVLRIKEIKYTDLETQYEIKRIFKYGKTRSEEGIYRVSSDPHANDLESGLGVIKRQIMPEDYMITQRLRKSDYNTVRLRTLTCGLHGDVTYSGSPIAYQRVTEYIQAVKDGQVVDNGKTVYEYQYPREWDSYNYMAFETNIYMDEKRDWQCGNLLSKKEYKRTGNNQYKLVHRTDYSYATFFKEKIKVGRVFQQELSELSNWDDRYSFYYRTYDIQPGAMRLSVERDSVFNDDGGTFVTVKEYAYGNLQHLYPTEIKVTNSDGSLKTQNMSYALDNSSIADSDHQMAKNKLIENWKINNPLETKETNYTGTVVTYNMYKVFPNNLPLFYKGLNKVDSNNQEERFICYNYDSYGNPIYISKDKAANIVYLWSYYGVYPVAEIKNATYDQVRTALNVTPESLSLQAAPNMALIDGLRTLLPDAFITTYTYKPLIGITGVTDSSGSVTYFEYDSSGRLKRTYIKDGNTEKNIESYQYKYKSQ